MFRLVVLSALVVAVFAAPHIKSSLPHLDGRIDGGENIQIEDYPYQLSLQKHGSHICGASIIGDRFAVTAAHCTAGSQARSLSIHAGSSIRESGGVVINVAAIRQHPDYNSKTIDYDISVLELAQPLTMGSGIQAVSLPEQGNTVSPGNESFVSGWGDLWEGGPPPSHLQGVAVLIVSRYTCTSAYGAYAITERMICAGFPEGRKDACQGDSGGPLVASGKLVGVVSWGLGCARPEYPGVYANVAALRAFITEVSGI